MLCTSDWRVGRQAYERLGFRLTPLRRNAPMGGGDGADGGSQLVMLGGGRDGILNYLELSTAVPDKAAPLMRQILIHDGPVMMVHYAADIARFTEHWSSLGVQVHRFEAAFPASGSLGGGRFDIAIADPQSVPLQFNVVCSTDRSGYRDAEWQVHDNGALAWREVIGVVPDGDLDAVAERHSRLIGIEPVQSEEGVRFDAGPVDIRLIAASMAEAEWRDIGFQTRAAPQIAGLRITVRDLATFEKLMTSRGVACLRSGDTVLVGPQDAAGSVMLFSEELS
ncbi:VOC family protein [Parasphingopyxis algicola]|uniref:VOC family protein n=1 Tax=Parasphingopyxis algicola TaxID=2026624 RepID=UPI001FEB7970|nr:VOC family protein [Parasphingopyxis algicola]